MHINNVYPFIFLVALVVVIVIIDLCSPKDWKYKKLANGVFIACSIVFYLWMAYRYTDTIYDHVIITGLLGSVIGLLVLHYQWLRYTRAVYVFLPFLCIYLYFAYILISRHLLCELSQGFLFPFMGAIIGNSLQYRNNNKYQVRGHKKLLLAIGCFVLLVGIATVHNRSHYSHQQASKPSILLIEKCKEAGLLDDNQLFDVRTSTKQQANRYNPIELRLQMEETGYHTTTVTATYYEGTITLTDTDSTK